MDEYLKITAFAILTLILYLVLNRYGRDYSVVLSIFICLAVLLAAINFLEPVLEFLDQLLQIADVNSELMKIMLKSAGIGLLSEITSLICSDAGNSALGKSLQILAVFTILWLSIPVFSALISIIQETLTAL